MKKVFLVVQKKDAEQALQALKGLGVLHPELEQKPIPERLQELKKELDRLCYLAQVLNQLPAVEQKEDIEDWPATAQHILNLEEKIRTLKEEIVKRKFFIDQWSAWGDFNTEDIKLLADQGIYVQLVEVPVKRMKEIPGEIIVEIVSQTASLARCALILRAKMDLPFSVLTLPPMGLKRLKMLQGQDEKDLQDAQRQLQESACYLKYFQKVLDDSTAELKFQVTLDGMGEAQGLAYLKGYCPWDACAKIEAAARKEQWALLISDPQPDDKVPTLLRNPQWVRLIEPIYNVINIMPGYRELDISPFFLIFFSIFFGLLIADAGYGTIFLITAILVHWKLGKKLPDKTFIFLLYVLSTVTIVWGLLTGTVFGTALFGRIFKPIVPWLTESRNVQVMCLTLGAVHLTLAHVWRLLNKAPRILGMLSEVGWIGLLWSALFLAKTMMLGAPLPGFVVYVLTAGIIFLIVDIVAQKQDIGVNLILLVFGVIGAFGDVVSYIRLFAVGLAGVAVADAFNQMAMDIGFHNIPGAILAGLILIFVHLFLNIALGILGVLVHGLRLNVLEFSSHLNLEWSGVKYDPLKNNGNETPL